MQFTVFAVSTVPDAATTRRLFQLDDLDDKSVAKVLFHRRKQQTGNSEVLRWDQRAAAAVTLLRHRDGELAVDSFGLDRHDEPTLVRTFFDTAADAVQLVSWDGNVALLPVLHFRSLQHGVSQPAYWRRLEADAGWHLDLLDWMAPAAGDRPGLDETARKLGLPGLFGRDEDSVAEAWLERRHAEVQAYSDLTVLNSYLLALRLFQIRGELAVSEQAAAHVALRRWLQERDSGHMVMFRDAWVDR